MTRSFPSLSILLASLLVYASVGVPASAQQTGPDESRFGRIARDFFLHPERYSESNGAVPSKDVANGQYDVRLSEPNEGILEFGASVASAGDVNGDGYNDVIVGGTNWLISTGVGGAFVYFGGPNMDEAVDLVLQGEEVDGGFGLSVAGAGDLNGDDYDDLVVGAPFRSNGGRVYIYYGGPSLDSTPDLILDADMVAAEFGYSVAVAGDLNGDSEDDLVVGAPNRTGSSDRAYVFFGGPGVDATADLTLAAETATAYFGHSVAGAGDVDGDDFLDLIVGAPSEGTAYVYSGGPSLDATPDLILGGGTSFGYSVAGAGDVDGDDHGDLIVGAPFLEEAYVYCGGPSLDQAADLTLEGDGGAPGFGHSVSGIDVNGDMRSDLIVGSSHFDPLSIAPSRTYVFFGGLGADGVADVTLTEPVNDLAGFSTAGVEDLDGDGFSEVLVGGFLGQHAYIFRGGATMDSLVDWTLVERAESTGNDFGVSVAGVGDVNGDSWDDVVVGAPGYTRTGRAYLYFGGPDLDGEVGLLLQPNQMDVAGFGTSVAAAGDVNGDNWPDIVVGAPSSHPLFGNYAFIFYGGPDMDGTPDVQLLGSGTFGSSVAGAGDINGDTYADVVVGQPESLLLYGLALVYFGGPDMDANADAVLSPQIMFDQFGASVALGDVNGDEYSDVIVGSPNFDSATGRVYVYYGGSTLDEPADATLDGENADDSFGFSVAAIETFDGDLYDDMMVGAPGFDGETGKVYVFRGGAPMDTTAHLLLSGPLPGSLFGYSVAGTSDLSGDTQADLLVGAPGFVSNTGRVLVYHGGSALDEVPDSYLDGERDGVYFGQSVAGLGDVNADLGGDIIVGAPGHGDNGAADIFYGASPPVFAKTFAPDVTGIGIPTRLTFTIDNSANSQPATTLTFQDHLPAGLVLAGSPTASTTCTGGTLSAGGGMSTLTYDGGTVGARESCTVQVDVVATTTGTFENVSNPLTSSLGTSLPARDILLVEPAPTFLKSFSPNKIAVGGLSTLIFTVDNTASSAAATSLAFTDNLPAALAVATPANLINGCGGTPTAVAGSGVISLSGGTVGAGSTCTLKVDVTSTAVGDHVNVTGDLTSSLGNSGPATDTLRVNPPPAFTMAFDPSSILVGGVSTLTLEFDNGGSTVAADDLAVTDDLPVEVLVADPANASNDCGGTLTASPGSGTVSLAGGSLAAGATCSVSVDVTSDVLGAHLNVTGAPTSTLGLSDPAEATLTVEDLAPPVVTAVTTNSGDLDECDTVRDPARTIHVMIEDDRTPLLGADVAANYLLVASGADGDFSTESCAGVAGDDVAIALQASAVQQEVAQNLGEGPVLTDVTLTLPEDPEGLARGLYRFFVCDTLTDTAGNALDGDGDTAAGGDFEISSFRADPFNLLVNGHFDDCPLTLDPWETLATAPNVVQTGQVETDDVASSTLSASARIVQSDVPSSQVSQCVPVDGDESYRFEYWLRYDAPSGGTGILITGCEFFDAATCGGSSIDEHVVGSLLEDGGGTWWFGEQELLSPETAASARCGAEVEPAGTDPFFDLYLDGLFFGPSDPLEIFQDGFESGDLSAWSSASP